MSEWFEVNNAENIELSDDGKMVEIIFDTDNFGNRYVTVPVGVLEKLLDYALRSKLARVEELENKWREGIAYYQVSLPKEAIRICADELAKELRD